MDSVRPDNGVRRDAPAFRVSPDVAARQLDDEVVLVHLETNQIYRLNHTGACVWELVAAGHPRDEIVESLTARFDADAGDVRGAVDALLSELLASRLIHAGSD